ncbi:MAG: hypothetical protein ACKOUT_14385 [Novosphingobium sp.]
MTGVELAKAAEALAGTPFRLHGRDPHVGLDCIGLIDCALAAIGSEAMFPNGYALRTGQWPGLDEIAAKRGFAAESGPVFPGDVMLLKPCASQMHFTIAGLRRGTWIEAHAGLRRVVITAISDRFPAIRRWRLV